jgi:hypothetical protein
LANLERILTPIPALHGERGRDKDGSLAATYHQIPSPEEIAYIKRFGKR